LRFEIPPSHPRYHSLVMREKLVEGFERGLVVPQGLIAHGRGEAFDYLIGEETAPFALEAARAAAAMLLLARRPVISVNGNYAVLAAREIGELQRATGALVEVNLFYRTEERVRRIEEYLASNGVERVLGGGCERVRLPGLESPRGIVCREGIYSADFVLVAIEDGDRTEALRRAGKKVAAIDLNPLSRTARMANITIVDEAVRATKAMAELAREMRGLPREELEGVVRAYDNGRVLSDALRWILQRLARLADEGVTLDPS